MDIPERFEDRFSALRSAIVGTPRLCGRRFLGLSARMIRPL